MTTLAVDCDGAMLHGFGRSIACSIGRAGACDAAEKREGDGMTPRGSWPLRTVLLRRDRLPRPVAVRLPWRWIARADGWSDDPRDPAYNRGIIHPHPFSAERLWRDDRLYDVIVTLGHNDTPAIAGAGSAIFLHCRDGTRPTEGCVAIAREDLLGLLARLAPGDAITIR